jgi:hypothetical protein
MNWNLTFGTTWKVSASAVAGSVSATGIALAS